MMMSLHSGKIIHSIVLSGCLFIVLLVFLTSLQVQPMQHRL